MDDNKNVNTQLCRWKFLIEQVFQIHLFRVLFASIFKYFYFLI